MDVDDRDAEIAIALDAIASHGLRFVRRIVEHLNLEQLARVIELRDSLDQALDHVALVVDRELNRDLRPLRHFRRRTGHVLAVLEIVVDEYVAVNAVHREDRHHEEVRQHDGEIEGVCLVEAAKRRVEQLVPVSREGITGQGDPRRQVVGRHRRYQGCGLQPEILGFRASAGRPRRHYTDARFGVNDSSRAGRRLTAETLRAQRRQRRQGRSDLRKSSDYRGKILLERFGGTDG